MPMLPSPPAQSPAVTAQAARLAIASDRSLEVSLGGPDLELAWRVVHAAETRKALLDARALSLRVRRTLPLSSGKPLEGLRPPLPSGLPRFATGAFLLDGLGGDSCRVSHCCR